MQEKVDEQTTKALGHLVAELVNGYLSEEPKDFTDFCIRFFRDKLIRRGMQKKSEIPEEIDRKKLAIRRASIYSESYDPNTSDFKPAVYMKTSAQKKTLMRAVKETVIFEALDEVDLIQLVNAMQSRPTTKDEYIIREGAKGDFLYVIEKGTFEAIHEDGGRGTLLKVYKDEGTFGELALMHNAPRACSVISRTVGQLWALDRKTFRHIVLGNQQKRKRRYEALISKVPILEVLTQKQKVTLVDALTSQVYRNGERIIREGDIADGLYFIESGRARVTIKCYETFSEKEVNRLKPGDYFGELSLITKKPRSASVYAVGRTTVAFLNTHAFERLLGPCKALMKQHFTDYEKQIHAVRNPNTY